MHRLSLTALAALTALATARADDPPRFALWEREVRAIEESDRRQPPPQGGIVFVGSSSIRLWDVKKSFPELPVVNHGFGGSQIADSTHFAARLVTPLKPRLVVFYAGDNDLFFGQKPERLRDDFRAFAQAVHKDLPKTKIIFLAIKPSPSRWNLIDAQRRANEMIAAVCRADERLLYLDVATPMLGADGKPRPELFVKDGLHLSEAGYRLWAELLKPHLR
jgi:lysophospholipase L1-like esterase